MTIYEGSEPQLFVVFSSWRKEEQMSKPYHEFKNVLSETHPNSHKIFLKDEKNNWFIKGINNKLNSISKIFKDINNYIKHNNITDINFLGSSMGGFGSILYGKLYSILYKVKTNVLSFSPQTILIKNSEILKYNKWTHNCLVDLKFNEKNKLLDLNNTLKRPSDCFICCVCSENTTFDIINIERIKNYISKWYVITDIECHNSAYVLQKNKELNNFIINYKNNNINEIKQIKLYK